MESLPSEAAVAPEPLQECIHFKTNTNIAFPGIAPTGRQRMHELIAELGIEEAQKVEAASYSLAMVVRYALGLSATGGRVCALVGNCLAGRVALATLRHLVNAGVEGVILSLGTIKDTSLDKELSILDRMGVPLETYSTPTPATPLLQSCHNVICGLYEAEASIPVTQSLIGLLNELHTPVHAIEAPLGVDPLTGEKENPLFASSTLSLGAPLIGLSAGFECVGRHYLCDISATSSIYKASGCADLTSLFAEQPVVQIKHFELGTEVP